MFFAASLFAGACMVSCNSSDDLSIPVPAGGITIPLGASAQSTTDASTSEYQLYSDPITLEMSTITGLLGGDLDSYLKTGQNFIKNYTANEVNLTCGCLTLGSGDYHVSNLTITATCQGATLATFNYPGQINFTDAVNSSDLVSFASQVLTKIVLSNSVTFTITGTTNAPMLSLLWFKINVDKGSLNVTTPLTNTGS